MTSQSLSSSNRDRSSERLPHEERSAETAIRDLTSEELFRGAQEVVIRHADAVYRLKITRQGKLILNK